MKRLLTIQVQAGFNACSILGGLAKCLDMDADAGQETLTQLFPHVVLGTFALNERNPSGIAGYTCSVLAPEPAFGSRTLTQIEAIYRQSALCAEGIDLAMHVWQQLANAEASVQNCDTQDVRFQTLGRLSHILAIGMVSHIFIRACRVEPIEILCSPLPLNEDTQNDTIKTDPTLSKMLQGVPTVPSKGLGPLVSATGLALLQGLKATFGTWPMMRVERSAMLYTKDVYAQVANGTLFVLGRTLD